MNAYTEHHEPHSRLRQFRAMRGMSQQTLAARAGVTRQTVSAIENQRYLPSVTVALRLARALRCHAEDLFPLSDTDAERPVSLVGAPPMHSRRVALAQVRERLVAYPLATGASVQEGFVSADGILAPGPSSSRARLLTPPEQLESTALVVGCDPGLGILGAHVARRKPDSRLAWLFASSRAALESVEHGETHAAGSHLQGGRGAEHNVSQAAQALRHTGGMVVAFASWEQGLVVPPGNPRRILDVEDLARQDVRIVNREEGSGCRETLDSLLLRAGIPAGAVRGYDRVVNSHMSVARSVASGGAEAGVTLRAAADACGLDFVPLTQVRFDLVIPHDMLNHPAISTTLEVMQSQALREELSALPGYEVDQMGRIVAEIPASA